MPVVRCIAIFKSATEELILQMHRITISVLQQFFIIFFLFFTMNYDTWPPHLVSHCHSR